jgi:hypothetical protein
VKAQLCPVCNGEGEVFKGTPGTLDRKKATCHGCAGKGWVEVHEEAAAISVVRYPNYPTYPLYPWWWNPYVEPYTITYSATSNPLPGCTTGQGEKT